MKATLAMKVPLWRYIAVPVIVYNVVPLIVFGLMFAAAYRTTPATTAPDPTQPLFWLYCTIALLNSTCALVAVGVSRQDGISLSKLLSSSGSPWFFHWRPALQLFVLYNAVWLLYVALYTRFAGQWPTYAAFHLWQRVLFLSFFPIIAGISEEIYWRGFVLARLQRAGLTAPRAIVIAAVGFSLIHGLFLPDKLLVTFVIAVLAGWYYVRERTLLPLIVTHIVVDVWSYGLSLFWG